MPPTLFRRRLAPAPAPIPGPRSLLETATPPTSEDLIPRSPSDNPDPQPQASQAEAVAATRVLLDPGATRVVGRQEDAAPAHTVSTIPSGYGSLRSGPDAGTVVGITLGSVGGFMLLMWIVWWCVNLGRPADMDTSSVTTTGSVLTGRLRRPDRGEHRRGHSHGRRHHRRGSGGETIEVRTTRRPFVVAEPGVREVLVEETTRARGASRPSAPPPPRVVVEDDDDDEVVVIEDNTPPRRHRSRRPSGYRDEEARVRRSSGSRRR